MSEVSNGLDQAKSDVSQSAREQQRGMSVKDKKAGAMEFIKKALGRSKGTHDTMQAVASGVRSDAEQEFD